MADLGRTTRRSCAKLSNACGRYFTGAGRIQRPSRQQPRIPAARCGARYANLRWGRLTWHDSPDRAARRQVAQLGIAVPCRAGSRGDRQRSRRGRPRRRAAPHGGCRSPSTPARPRTPSWQPSWRCTSPSPAMAKCSARWVSICLVRSARSRATAANWRSLSLLANRSTGCVAAPDEWRPGPRLRAMPKGRLRRGRARHRFRRPGGPYSASAATRRGLP